MDSFEKDLALSDNELSQTFDAALIDQTFEQGSDEMYDEPEDLIDDPEDLVDDPEDLIDDPVENQLEESNSSINWIEQMLMEDDFDSLEESEDSEELKDAEEKLKELQIKYNEKKAKLAMQDQQLKDLEEMNELMDEYIAQYAEDYQEIAEIENNLIERMKPLFERCDVVLEQMAKPKARKPSQNAVLQAKCDELEKKIRDLQPQYDAAMENAEKLKDAKIVNVQLQEEMKQVQERIKMAEDVIQEQEKTLKEMDVKENEAKHYVDQLRDEIFRSQAEFEVEYKAKLAALDNLEKEEDQLIAEHYAKVNDLYTEMEKVQNKMQQAIAEEEAQEDYGDDLEAALNDQKREQQSLKRTNEELIAKFELADMKAKHRVEQFKARNERTKAELNAAIQAHQKLQSQMFDAHCRESNLKKEIKDLEIRHNRMQARVQLEQNQRISSTPEHFDAPPPYIPSVSSISPNSGGSIKHEAVPQDAVVPAAVPLVTGTLPKPRMFFRNVDPPGARFRTTQAPSTNNPANAVSEAPPTNRNNSEVDLFSVGFDSDDSSCFEVQIITKPKKNQKVSKMT